jgi:hypothetical protein
MEVIRDDTSGGTNAVMNEQKDQQGEAKLVAVQLDKQNPHRAIHCFEPIENIPRRAYLGDLHAASKYSEPVCASIKRGSIYCGRHALSHRARSSATKTISNGRLQQTIPHSLILASRVLGPPVSP